jgi:hypothetical protein
LGEICAGSSIAAAPPAAKKTASVKVLSHRLSEEEPLCANSMVAVTDAAPITAVAISKPRFEKVRKMLGQTA